MEKLFEKWIAVDWGTSSFRAYLIYNNNSIIGKIIDVVENKNQDLFEVVFNENRILIPLVDEFVVNIDNENKKIIMNLPEGLTDL